MARQESLSRDFRQGWPSRWEGSKFNAKNNETAIEILEMGTNSDARPNGDVRSPSCPADSVHTEGRHASIPQWSRSGGERRLDHRLSEACFDRRTARRDDCM
jgi:hypothetical protein